jgi:hypothetical protein
MAGAALWALGLAVAVLLVIWAAVSSSDSAYSVVLGVALLIVFVAIALTVE